MVVAINLFGNLLEEEEEECHDSLDLSSPGGDIGGGESFQYSGLAGQELFFCHPLPRPAWYKEPTTLPSPELRVGSNTGS